VEVPPNPAPALTLNDPAVTTITTTAAGQNAEPTFVATAGQAVTVRFTGNTLGYPTLSLVRPNGTIQHQTALLSTNYNWAVTPSVSGTYTVRIDPSGTITGSVGVRVTAP
jgi:hypothetical protein